MTRRIEVRPEAEQDALNAFRYYEEIRAGLGREFLGDVREQIDRILKRLKLYARKHGNIRRAQMKRFPYGFAYTYDVRTETVQVLAIMHAARHPDHWRRRA